ncbi:MAG: UbiA family prenyltransferase, partial [Candidatus Zixiibacteriota bacterium]
AGTYNLLLPPGPIIPAVFAFLFHLGREWVKDMADLDGDKSAGYRTLPMILSRRAMLAIITILYSILISTTLIPIYLEWYNTKFFITAVFLVDIPLIIAIIYSWFSKDNNRLKILGSILKLLMAIGLAAFIMGKY